MKRKRVYLFEKISFLMSKCVSLTVSLLCNPAALYAPCLFPLLARLLLLAHYDHFTSCFDRHIQSRPSYSLTLYLGLTSLKTRYLLVGIWTGDFHYVWSCFSLRHYFDIFHGSLGVLNWERLCYFYDTSLDKSVWELTLIIRWSNSQILNSHHFLKSVLSTRLTNRYVCAHIGRIDPIFLRHSHAFSSPSKSRGLEKHLFHLILDNLRRSSHQ